MEAGPRTNVGGLALVAWTMTSTAQVPKHSGDAA